ncbi:MAG TPA: hypothetical protein VLL54_20685 [Pyrinomonadaceae bacterium]|nr:hypothetical protein [Pyrinomonadaceae bacterium]
MDLGFSVPPSCELNPELSEQLLTLSLQAAPRGADLQGREQIIMFADYYGGEGLGPALGAGRAGFLPFGNLYVKGVGLTPLFKHNDPTDFAHSHGGVHFDDCVVEAVFGEVNENLFVRGSSRVVAVIDQGKHVTTPSGRRIPIALVVRTGAQLRPGHLLIRERSKQAQLTKFVNIATATGQLVTWTSSDGELPNLKATMLKIIDDHAQTAAEGFRWRMIHGALTASNMEFSGAMLDLPTQSAQPRTAPVWLLEYEDSFFGTEHLARAIHLAPMYRKLCRNVPLSDWAKLHLEPINFRLEMTRAYDKRLQVELLNAVGFKKAVSQRIQAEHQELAHRFTQLIMEMSALKNRGRVCVARLPVETVAVLDVFNLLRVLPGTFFANPTADHRPFIYEQLLPILKGNRHQRARQRARVNAFAERLSVLYRELMTVSAAYAHEFYGNQENFQASVAARAGFENQPMELLYSSRLFQDFRQAIASYKSSSKAKVISEAIDRCIAASLRRVDGLLRQGASRLMPGGGIETQMRTLGGIQYSLKAWNDRKQTRQLHVGIPVHTKGNYYFTTLSYLSRLTKSQIQSLRYHFTRDGWLTSDEVPGFPLFNEDDGHIISFTLPFSAPFVGRLEGIFSLESRKPSRQTIKRRKTIPYVFAIPDRQELESLLETA